MSLATARRQADRRSTRPPGNSSTTWACARWKSCRRWRKSRRRCSLSPFPPPKRASAQPTRNLREPPVQKAERLQKVLAAAGLGSRREIGAWIEAGRITVNGAVAKLGDRADAADKIAVDGKPVPVAGKSAGRLPFFHKTPGGPRPPRRPQGRPPGV